MFAPNNESLIENSETVITNNRKQNTVGGANENNCFDQEESGFQVISNTTTALLSNVSLVCYFFSFKEKKQELLFLKIHLTYRNLK